MEEIEAVATIELSGEALYGVGAPQLRALTEQLPSTVKLGRIKPKSRPMALALDAYVDEERAAGTLPPSTNRRAAAAASLARMYMNQTLGCCVISGKAHALGLWSGADRSPGGVVLATDQEIQQQYVGICGPGDRGCVITDVLDVMVARGFLAGGKYYKLDGYVSADWRNKTMWQVGIFLLGAGSIGFDLPSAWQSSAVWDVTDSRIVGGHDVTPVDYDERGVYVASWGRVYLMTWAAVLSTRWVSELYFMLDELWYGDDQLAPSGVKVDELRADLEKIGGGTIPPIPGPDVPPVVPPVTPPPVVPPVTPPDAPTITLSRAVRAGQSVWFPNAKPAGVYVRRASGEQEGEALAF